MPEQQTQPRQQQIDKMQRAQERIDRDPEEAQQALSRAKATDGSPITVEDMFGLFKQLTSAMTALQQRQAEQQEAIISVLTNQQTQQQRSQRDTEEELQQAAKQREMTLESWRTEPKDAVFLQPEISEEKIHAVMNEYPPRVFRINGLEYPIKVGEVVTVPASIAALVRHSQKQKPLSRGPQQIPEIPDPNRGQFLAAANEVSAGRAGNTGEGWVRPAAVALSPDGAQPLDVRYDAFGR